MFYWKEKPNTRWIKADKKVITDRTLSDGAKILFLQLHGLIDGHNEYEAHMYKRLGLSKTSYYRYKKELVDKGLVMVVQTGPRDYEMYIGNSSVQAAEVKARKKLAGKKVGANQ